MDYPFDISFSDKAASGAIRLRVAALCAAIDHGYIDGVTFTEAELGPFTEQRQYVARDGKKHDVWLKPHAFVLIQPDGNLERAANKILNALMYSILSGELGTIQLRKSLSDEIDELDTWIGIQDFRDWCEVRDIDLGNLFDQYHDDEMEISIAAQDTANTLRSKFETPYFDKDFNERLESDVKDDVVTLEQYQKVLTENLAMLGGKFPNEKDDRPMLTRERNTLLAIIASLCDVAGYDHRRPAKTAGLIQSAAARLGLNIGETTIENHLKKIPDAMRSRSK